LPDQPYQTLHSRYIWRSQWYALREDQVRFPDGSLGTFTMVEKPGSVYIVPQLTDGRLVLLRNYRYTLKQWLWEVPAGGIQPGMSPEDMARQELAEEAGGTAGQLRLVASFYTMPGIGDELAHVFFASDVTLGDSHHEPGEVMEIHLIHPQEAVRMVQEHIISDGASAYAILLCAPYLKASE
jgi:ADP-ribose pyrophosphatase